MPKFLSLLKYVDRNRLTVEGLNELLSLAGVTVERDTAEKIVTAFKTRGFAGLLPYTPELVGAFSSFKQQTASFVVTCEKCGECKRIELTREQFKSLIVPTGQTQNG